MREDLLVFERKYGVLYSHIPELRTSHPHYKHVPPDIKHNRIPAPGLSFTQPNLPFLIKEIEREVLGDETIASEENR